MPPIVKSRPNPYRVKWETRPPVNLERVLPRPTPHRCLYPVLLSPAPRTQKRRKYQLHGSSNIYSIITMCVFFQKTDRFLTAATRLLLFVMLLSNIINFSKTVRADTAIGGDFSLIDHDGNNYSLRDARGKLVILFFGYTSCPDICPTSLISIKAILQQLGEHASDIQPLFVSVDPERDTPAVLKSYVSYFHPSIIGLTGTTSTLTAISQRYQALFNYSAGVGRDSYIVNHSSNLYIIDAQGQLISIIPFGTPVDHIIRVIEKLLEK